MSRDGALEAVFQPVRTPTTFEETVERLGGAIRTGLLTPGSKLPPERELAERLRISRSTLRQALTTLVQSGHLTSARGRSGGTFVAESPPLSDRGIDPLDGDAHGVLDLRVAIELGAVALALERASNRDLDRLGEWIERMQDPPDFESYRRADVRFHVGLAEAARSPRLVAAMSDVHAQLTDLLALIAHPSPVLAHANAQHERIAELVRRRDRARAVRLMREHIEGTEHILAGLI
jgi:GntR family transcriptional regulator, transcriptional repressor for pyruvate dehydrogenase complex